MSKKNTQGARRRQRQSEQLERREMLAADILSTIISAEGLLQTEAIEIASYDGTDNNLENEEWGTAGIELLRLSSVEYADGLSDPAGEDRVSAREISNLVADQAELINNDRFLTDFVWIWGQFIDHDIDLSVDAEPIEAFDIEVPTGDPDFDPFATGEVTIGLDRSEYEVDDEGVRQQLNTITAYLDGSVIYGSSEETANSLREFSGGRMLTSEGDLLPIGEDGFFMAGDVRANENVALTSMHTLWVREHNLIADAIAEADPTLTDEEIFQQTRSLVVAEIQAITYNEWLPALLGVDAMSDYAGYDPAVNSSIANVFSSAAYRFGHSMLSTELLRLNTDGTEAEEGNLSLADAFFSPDEVVDHGIDSILLGASSQVAQEIDSMIVDDVRNFLFGPPGAGGLDLASLNIQRGRDHGLPDYNQLREDYGLERVTSFDEITSSSELASKLEQLYESVDNIDPWVGILAEDHVDGSSLGELGRTILVDQFERIRSGDRLWYENRFEGETLSALQQTTLSSVIVRNTEVDTLRDNVFFDESVLFYQSGSDTEFAGRQRGPNEMMLIAQAGELRLIDTRNGELLTSSSAEETTKVVLMGSQGNDRVLVHPSVLRLSLEGGITIDGDQGGRDQVVLMGSDLRDNIAIDGAFASFNETSIQVEGIEELIINTGPGTDDVEVVDRGEYRLAIDEIERDRDPRQRRDRTPRELMAQEEMAQEQDRVRQERLGRDVQLDQENRQRRPRQG